MDLCHQGLLRGKAMIWYRVFRSEDYTNEQYLNFGQTNGRSVEYKNGMFLRKVFHLGQPTKGQALLTMSFVCEANKSLKRTGRRDPQRFFVVLVAH